jgi:hypothetical protein
MWTIQEQEQKLLADGFDIGIHANSRTATAAAAAAAIEPTIEWTKRCARSLYCPP